MENYQVIALITIAKVIFGLKVIIKMDNQKEFERYILRKENLKKLNFIKVVMRLGKPDH